MGCDSAIRRYEIPPLTTTWMDLEMIILREISQPEKVEKSRDITYMRGINLKATNEQDKQTGSWTCTMD